MRAILSNNLSVVASGLARREKYENINSRRAYVHVYRVVAQHAWKCMQILGLIRVALPYGSMRRHCHRMRYYLPGNGWSLVVHAIAHARAFASKNTRTSNDVMRRRY